MAESTAAAANVAPSLGQVLKNGLPALIEGLEQFTETDIQAWMNSLREIEMKAKAFQENLILIGGKEQDFAAKIRVYELGKNISGVLATSVNMLRAMELAKTEFESLQNIVPDLRTFLQAAPETIAGAPPVAQEVPDIVNQLAAMAINQDPIETRMNNEQQAVFDKVMDHIENEIEPSLKLFLSGTAGTGKSFVIKKIRDALKSSYGKQAVLICGTTGVASLAIDGQTIHSALKLPIEGEEKFENPLEPLDDEQIGKVRRLLENTRLLVIDEISMLNNKQLYMIDARLREVRNKDLEFGGVHVVLMGDLLQLPPVKAPFIFSKFTAAKDWFKSGLDLWEHFEYAELTKNCRVQDGPESEFSQMLSKIRLGHCTPDVKKFVQGIPLIHTDKFYEIQREFYENEKRNNRGKKRTLMVLCGTKVEVDAVNKKWIDEQFKTREMLELQTKLEEPDEVFAFEGNKDMLEDKLYLAPGVRVMLLRNLGVKNGLVNGSMGTVESIHDAHINVKFDDKNKETKVERMCIAYETSDGLRYAVQYPLRLAYASTVHKAQGLTVDGVLMNVSNIFESGQFFVMLSRAKDLSLCRITSRNPLKKPVKKELVKECNRLRESAGMGRLDFNVGR